MDEQTAKRTAYSWGARFHLAVEVESAFGKSLKTACGKLRDPKKVMQSGAWGAIPQIVVCPECKGKESAVIAAPDFQPSALWASGENGGCDLVSLVKELSQDWTWREREAGWRL